MKPQDEKIPGDRFEDAWKEWVQRPPRQSPAQAAAGVRALILRRRQRRQYIWALSTAAAVLLAVAVAIHWARVSYRSEPVQPTVLIQEAPILSQGEVLMWLDKDTPLYMTFQPPEGGDAKGGKL